MLTALKKHKKFKQMCSFALDTLCKSIDPVNNDWNSNVDELVHNGGIEQLADILKLYPHDEDVFGYCSKILARVPKNYRNGKRYTKMLVESGAVKGILESMQNMADLRPDSVENAASLLLSAAQRNAQSMADDEHVRAVLKCAAKFPKSKHIQHACNRAVELICKSAAGREAFLRCGGTSNLLDSFNVAGSTDESVLSGLRCINRICLQTDNLQHLDVDGAVGAVVTVLENHKDNEAINVVGSRLLSRLTAATINDVLASLQNSSITDAERARGYALVSNLAMERQKAQLIVDNAGVQMCIDTLLSSSASSRVQAAAAATLARIAFNDSIAADIMAKGGMEALVKVFKANSDNPHVVATVLEALEVLLINDNNLRQLIEQGGVDPVVNAVAALASDKSVALQGMKFCTSLVGLDYDIPKLIEHGGVEAALNCIREHPGDTHVLGLAMSLLSAMADTNAENAAHVAKHGGIDIALENLHKYHQRPDIVEAALSLLATLSQDKSNVEQLAAKNADSFIIDAMYANPENETIQTIGAQVLRSLVTEDMIVKTLAAIQKAGAQLLEKKNAVSAANCVKLLMTLQAYATCNTDLIVARDGHQIVHNLFLGISKQKKLPKKGMVIYGVYRVLNELFARYRKSAELFDTLNGKINNIGKEFAEIQKNSKNTNHNECIAIQTIILH